MKKLLIFSLLPFLALSCTRSEELTAEVEPALQAVVTNEGLPDDLFCEGCINVKVTPEFAAEIEANTDGEGQVNVSAVKSMGFAVKDLGIVRMKRLFPYAGKFEERTRKEGLHLWYEIRYDEDKSVTKASGDLKLIDGIEIIDPKPIMVLEGSNEVAEYLTPTAATTTAGMPFNDPNLGKQWHYYNDGSVSSSFQSGCDINVFPVWKSYTTGNPDVIVAIVDGGIDYSHEDLADNMWHDPEDTRRVGFNFCTNNYVITSHNHGTHVAGTVAAVNNNGLGVCGVAGGDAAKGQKGVSLMSCQIFASDGSQGSGELAIKWAADHGAVIAQNSWGLSTPASTPEALKTAIDYFIKYAGFDENGVQVGPMAGGLVVFSAGNESSSKPYGTDYEGMFTVSAVGPDYCKAYYSNYGDWCDIAAPGGDTTKGGNIWSTLPGNQYGTMTGTSMACPHVSGVAALVVSRKGGQGYTCQALRNALESYTTDISAYNRNIYVGKGLVNAYLAIAGSGGKAPDKVTDYSLSVKSNTVTVTARIPADQDDDKPNSLIVYYSTSSFSSTEGLKFSSFYVGDLKAGAYLTGSVTGLDFSQKYYFSVVACDLAGNKSALSELKTATTGINHAPVITPESPVKLTLKAHETEQINISYSDPDGHYMNFRQFAGSSAEKLDTAILNNPVLAITGADAPEGDYTFRLVVSDIYGLSDTLDVNYTILENHPPVVVAQIPDQVLNGMNDSRVLNETDYFKDEDGEQLKYGIQCTDESVMNVSYSKGKFYLTPMGFGMAEITLTAKDVKGETAVQSFKVLVRDSNEPADIYPNPMHDVLKIRTSEDATVTVKIVGMQGSVMYEGTKPASPFSPLTIDVKDYPTGSYTVSLEYDGGSIRKSVVKI